MTAVTTRTVDQAARLYTARVPITTIAANLGVSPATVRYHLRARGLFPAPGACPSRRANLPNGAIDDAARAYEAGSSIRGCAKRLMVSYKTARTALLEAGVTFRPQGTRSTPNGDQ